MPNPPEAVFVIVSPCSAPTRDPSENRRSSHPSCLDFISHSILILTISTLFLLDTFISSADISLIFILALFDFDVAGGLAILLAGRSGAFGGRFTLARGSFSWRVVLAVVVCVAIVFVDGGGFLGRGQAQLLLQGQPGVGGGAGVGHAGQFCELYIVDLDTVG